jgi:oligopeptide transport system ATP-binding protein
VMYAGRIVEHADVYDLYARPAHPYSKGLLESIPRLDQKGQELAAIGGLPPNLMRIPAGCSFNPRCRYAQDVCRVDDPALREVGHHRRSACHFAEDVLAGTATPTKREVDGVVLPDEAATRPGHGPQSPGLWTGEEGGRA